MVSCSEAKRQGACGEVNANVSGSEVQCEGDSGSAQAHCCEEHLRAR